MADVFRRRALRTLRGFTLIELLIVVVIVGVVATLAVFGVRKYIYASKTSEAINMIGSIKAAQESYRDETFTYLNVSNTLGNTYPMATPGRRKWAWGGKGAGFQGWMTLGVTTDQPVQFGYSTVAGAAKASVPQPETDRSFNWPGSPTEPWYVVQAKGDLDGDGDFGYFVSSSFNAEIASEDEGE